MMQNSPTERTDETAPLHSLLNSYQQVEGWALTIGFFVGVLGTTWADVLFGLSYDVTGAATATLSIFVVGVALLYRDVANQSVEVA